MATEHTPGPWTVDPPEQSGPYLIASLWSSDKHIATVNYTGVDFDSDTEPEANARLIAAAPELLAALETFWTKYKAAPDGDLGIGLVNGDFFAVREAINKANGDV